MIYIKRMASFSVLLASLSTLAILFSPESLTAQTLEYADFKQQVLKNHPLSKKADLYLGLADAVLLKAKGGFDPKTYLEYSGKNFNGKTYFQYSEAGLKVPTWAGLEFKGGYNLASGYLLNPEGSLPKNGQANLGLVWTLGQGLLFDERRAGLQIARAGLQMSEAERLEARNDLMVEANKAYWTWSYAENAVGIILNALRQAEIRHEGMRQSFIQGERSAFDTLETFIQVQSRQVELQFAQVDAQNAVLELSVFLWNTNNQMLSPEQIPAAPTRLTIDMEAGIPLEKEDLLQIARTRHPELQQYQIKIRQLSTELRLKNEKRKPVLDLSYNLLGNAWDFFPTVSANGPAMFVNDIKWGLDFNYPILNRKARGDWQLTRLKIIQTELELQHKRQTIEVKVQQYTNDLINLRSQAILLRDVTANYRRLLDGENEKFANGESSVFLVNTREQRWLDAQLKYLKLLSELRKAEAGVQWAAGVLGQ